MKAVLMQQLEKNNAYEDTSLKSKGDGVFCLVKTGCIYNMNPYKENMKYCQNCMPF